MRARFILTAIAFVVLCAREADAFQPPLSNPILFVTQVPMPLEVNDNAVSNVRVSVVSALGNHLADTAHAGRGGDLWLLLPNGGLKNLTRAGGFGVNGAQHGAGIAVRDPHVHWGGAKAIFSMVVGAPTGPGDATLFFWQLYEITNLTAIIADTNVVPAIIKIANQPPNYNNVNPCYSTDGRIIFACDRPRSGDTHLYPQLDEYNDVPSNTGLWSFDTDSPDPAGGLFQLDHSPSGSFTPFIDSFGRLIFVRWDHLVQDRNATDDRMGRANNGTFNYFSEAGTSYSLTNRPIETFPEPRTYDSNLLAQTLVQGNAFNSFLPWMGNEDGTGLEVLNHVGRHELLQAFRGSSFTNDSNLQQQFNLASVARFNSNYLNNLFQMREDPRRPGTYFGIDGPDFGTHASGQIVTLFGPAGTNAERMYVSYITPKSTAGPNALGVWRDPLPMTNGTLVTCASSGAALDSNIGTATAPRSRFAYRLTTLTNAGSTFVNAQLLTGGLTNLASYYVGNLLVTNLYGLWELQPVEVSARPLPPHQVAVVNPIEARVFAEEGVIVPDMQAWLRSNNLALLVSRNVTARDRADREQPFNLRVPGGVQTLGTNIGKIYDIAYLQYYQADQLRGLTYGGGNPVPGRRVIGVPMHDPVALAFNLPATNAPMGATRLGLDGSQAAFVPARRAMTHQTTDATGQHVVRERYWLTYQPGEIRTCATCHGLNQADQAGRSLPTNAPAALHDLLRYWKQETGYAKILSGVPTGNVFRANITAPPQQTNVLEATSDFMSWAAIGTNFGTTNGLFWLDDSDYTNTLARFYRVKRP